MYNYANYYQPPQQTDERIYVQGEDSARAYLVTANGFVRLWDSTKPVFYEKRADAMGRPYMDAFEYHKIENTPANSENGINGLTEQLNALKGQITALTDRVKELEGNNGLADDTSV